MHNWKHRALAAMLSLLMLASMLVSAVPANAADELVNVALKGSATTEDGNYDSNVIGNVIDGELDTNWQTRGVWPSTAVVQLDMGRSISEVVVKLGGDADDSRSLTVVVEYAQNGVTSDLIAFGEQTVTLTGDMEARFTVSQSVSATHFFVTLMNPKDGDAVGQFWPCVNEIEIYEKQEVKISDYNNIAAQADITATGDNEHEEEDSDNLVDGNPGTLYKFFNDQLTSEQSVILTFEQARSMDAVAIAFEHADPEPYNYAFTYSILARNGDGAYDTIVERFTANRTDKRAQQYKFLEKTYSEIKIVMHSCTNNVGNGIGWPAIAEFEVYGSEAAVSDGCISNGKSVHASSGQSTAKNITDGSKNSTWRGSYYPGYVDIDLGANYCLDAVEVYTPENGYSQYSIYTSLDGRDFDKLAEKTSRDQASLATGESYPANGKEARIVRVYLEYNSNETAAVINEVRVLGEATGTDIQELPLINVVDFDKSDYANMTVTAQDTYNEVFGIIQRRLGEQYKSWFTLELAPSANTYDYFELSTVDGKVHVKGNDGVSLATGINHYLKYYCNVHISQVGDQVDMPESAPVITGTVHKETKAEVRYSYNYCTLSYSMAFWGEEEWRNELDWLALNGVNVVLDATAQEEVWRRFLGNLGYTHQEAKDYIAGPAYYAWAYMANLSGFGGPVHDSWFEERTELARKNQKIMRALGMQPVLQGYSGMVPTDITSKATGDYALTGSDIIAQGGWCSFQRPAMLRTTSAAFDKYAELFYQCQKEVYGDTSDFYATDPFHEGGNTGGMSATAIAREVLTSMLAADSNAIWIIQAWQGNPTTALLNGLDDVENGAQHALVLDLYAEKTPHNQETGGSYGDTKEFDDTPWLYCMLNNFGGRLGLHGHLDNMAREVPKAFNNGKHIAGIGITPEASVNNPVLYDFLFETIWQDDASQPLQEIDLNTWLDDYATRRYGAESDSANGAWDILKETVYKGSLNNLGQGAPESVVNARPALSIKAASTWGNAVVSYDKVLLEEAALLLLEDYDVLKESKGYQYDLANVLQQVLSNSAQEYQKKMAAAYNSRDLASFQKHAATFLEIIGYMETVTATSEYFLLGRWVEQAKALAKNADDFTKDLYEFNAKALVTTWGSYNQAETGGLKDYSNRQWSGLIGDFYKVRWERWITARTNELKGESYESSINWFQWEWEWARSNKTYTTAATTADLETLGYEILEKFTSSNPASNPANDIDPTTMEVYAENYEPNNDTEGDPSYVTDGDPSTHWHTVWRDTDRSTQYLIFTFEEVTEINGMRFLQRSGGPNGVVTKFDLLVRESVDAAWKTLSLNATTGEWITVIDDGVLDTAAAWQMVNFEPVKALQVKFQVVDGTSNDGRKYGAAAEVRFTVPAEEKCKHESYTGGICDNCGAIHPDAVASVTIGETTTYYLDLQAALDAAVAGTEAAPAMVTVLKDVELDGAVYANGGVFTLDLNGFELFRPVGSGSVINVSKGTEKMTVIDTSEAQTGKMTSALGSCIYQNGGIVNILGGTFSGNGDFALFVQSGGLMNIKGGTIRCGEGTLLGRESPIRIGNQGAVIVSGGTISGGNYDFNFQASSASLVLSIDDNGVGATFPGGLSLYCYQNESTLNSVLAEGAAYWQNGKPRSVADDATKITGGDVTVEAVCDHSGNTNTRYTNNGDGTHRLICSVCNGIAERADHTFDENGTCSCGVQAVATVTVGDTVTYYLTMESAIAAAANINEDATIHVIRSTNALTVWNDDLWTKSNVDLVINEGVIMTLDHRLFLGSNLSGTGTIDGSGEICVDGTTENVTVTCDFAVYGTIQSGTFTGKVETISGTIAGGTFSGMVVNGYHGTITGGIFDCAVTNQGLTFYDSSYPLEDQLIERGTITSGTFNAEVENKGGLITGGTFNGTLTNADNIELDRDENGDLIEVVTPGMIINTETPTTFTLGEAFSVEKRGGTIECTSHIWDSTTGACRLCAAPCEHTFDSTTGECSNCETDMAVASVTIGETTTYYLDLQAALDAAVAGTEAAPAMVTVLKDVELDGEVYADGGVFTLDLNGFELSCPAGYGSVINVSNGTEKMTVIDTSEAQTGKMTSALGSCIYQNGGIVNILGGTFSGNSEFALYVQEGGLMNIKGGTIRCGEGTLFGRESPIRIGNQGAVIVSGGTISGGNYDFNFQGSSASLVLSIDDNGVGATFPGGLSLYCYQNESTLNSVLAEGAAYWQNGKPLSVDDDATEITGGDVTVKAVCDHSGNTNTQYIDNGDGTHSLICSVCDAAVETAEHTGGEAICETGKICETCGAEYTDALGHDDADKDHVCDNGCNVPQGEHKAAEGSHDCGYCGETITECADTDKDHNCDTCGDKLSDCADTDKDHNCDTCGTKLSDCADTDKDHNCDTCGTKLSDCADTDKDHNCDTCGEKLSDCGDTKPADHKCDICGKVLSTCGDQNQDGKCDVCGAITVPAKPYNIVNVVSGVHVYWKTVPGAVKYGLWRSETGKNGSYKWIANPTVPHFTDTKVESGKTYYYKVTTMVADGTHSNKSDAIGIVYVGTPDITSRVNKAAGITVGWNKIEGAQGYAIYRKSYSGTDAWVRVATISGNSTFTWQDTSVKNANGTAYKYTVRALAGSDLKTLSGCRNAGRSMVRLTSRTLNSAVKASATSIKCSWTTSSVVTGYEVRFMVGSTVYKTFTVGDYKIGVKTFTGLKAGQTYKIQVRSYVKIDGMGFYSAWSEAKNVTLP